MHPAKSLLLKRWEGQRKAKENEAMQKSEKSKKTSEGIFDDSVV